MSNQDIVNEWLKIAYEDYYAASSLYELKYRKPLEIICYHCQQSVEKSLKGFLCAKDTDVPKTHDNSLLCRLCFKLDEAFSEFFDSCEEIDHYATGTRYPNRIEIQEPIVIRALQQALAVYEFVSERIRQSQKTKKKASQKGKGAEM